MLSGWILDLYPCPEGMVLWLVEPEGKRRRLIDRSFTPCFYVHGPELRLTPLAQVLAARAAVRCALTEKTNIWDGGELRVLEVAVRHPTQFAALVRFVHQYDSSLRLYNSDLMLAPMYCWEKGVFPLAKVEVDEHAGAGDWGLGARAGTAQPSAALQHLASRSPPGSSRPQEL